jgi:hypothetical protein
MKWLHLVPAVLCLLTISCGKSNSPKFETANSAAAISPQDIKLEEADKAKRIGVLDTSAERADNVFNQAAPIIEWDKKIIKTANMEVECKDYTAFNRRFHATVRQYGGWIAAEAETQEGNRINNSVSVKVPVMQFEDLVNTISSSDAKLLSKSITTQDVTGEVVDAEGRVKVKKAMRDKYIAMLGQAGKIQDVLTVQEKIDEIHEEIEMNATRAESLKHQAAYSTINIHYYQPLDAVSVKNDEPGFGNRLVSAVVGGAAWLADLLVALLSIWPLVLVAIAAWYFIRKKFTTAATVKTSDQKA